MPTAASLYLTALYNFAITGSVRPDALFLAWGPGGVTSARVGQGVLGLLLDARYGILPYVPILMLAAAGLVLGGARRFAVVMPAAAVYYLTVASADNWAGAVCNLGRYFMPVAPLAVALVGIAIDRALSSRGTSIVSRPEGSADAGAETADPSSPGETELVGMTGEGSRRGVLALVLVLAAWTGLFAMALWQDPHAANDSALLLAKSTYADGHQYVPDLFLRRWSDAAPGLWARVAAWVAALAGIAWWLRRVASSSRRGHGARRLAAAALSRWWRGSCSPPACCSSSGPGGGPARHSPGRCGSRPTDDARRLFVSGAARVREDEAILGPGAVELRPARSRGGLEPAGDGRRPGRSPAGDRPPAARPAPDRVAPRAAVRPLP